MPPALTRLRRRLGSSDEGDRRFVRVLACVQDDGLEAVEDAVSEALEGGVASDEVIPEHPGAATRAAAAGGDHDL